MNEKLLGLKCSQCESFFKSSEVLYCCPKCGGILETIYDYEKIESDFKGEDLWKYTQLLPTSNRSKLFVGSTPLYKFASLNKRLGLRELWVKDDTKNPTGSLKDRASAVVVVLAKELGYKAVACASTGNAASSLAGIAASEGMESYLFVPKSISLPKLTQLQVFNAKVLQINASYDECFELCNQIAQKYNWYNRNTAYNPYTLDGKKTVAFEIAEQLNWKAPDKIFIPVGDGCIISSVWKGFIELRKLGLVSKLPKLIGVQAEGCKPLKDAFDKNKGKVERVKPKTLAESIAVSKPRNGIMALRDVRNSRGKFVSVSDEEMFQAMKLLASTTGIFGELAAVASLAAIKKELKEGSLDKKEQVVALITGSGLKDIEVASKLLERVPLLEPKDEEICGYIERKG
jgi:threonine synthase